MRRIICDVAENFTHDASQLGIYSYFLVKSLGNGLEGYIVVSWTNATRCDDNVEFTRKKCDMFGDEVFIVWKNSDLTQFDAVFEKG